MGKLSATICVPFGAETVENDPCTVGTTRNYTAGTGNRQNTSAQAKERNRQAFQRRMAQKTSRIHVAERETSQVFGAEFPVSPDQQVWARSYAPCGGVIQAVDCNVAFDG